MAKRHNKSDEVVALDVFYYPDVRRIAEEVERTGRPKFLKRGDKEIAKIVPVHTSSKTAKYNLIKLRTALDKAGLAMVGMDPDKMIENIYSAREMGSRSAKRP